MPHFEEYEATKIDNIIYESDKKSASIMLAT